MVQLKAFAAATALVSSAFAATHTVAVGGGGDVFTPNSVSADVGDVVEFHFSGEHSVASSAFDSPCKSTSTDIFSGVMSSVSSFILEDHTSLTNGMYF
jgi:plastocyanin